MHERFHDGLDAATLRALAQRSNSAAAVRSAVQVGLLLASTAVVLTAHDSLRFWVAFALQVLLQFAMFGMLHESIHGTAFAAAPANAAAAWIAAVWQFAPPAWMRSFHFEHHRHTHELAHDPELAGIALFVNWPRGLHWLATVSGLLILFARVLKTLAAASGWRRLFAVLLPYVTEGQRGSVVRDARILLLVHGALTVLALTALPAIGWLYAAAVAAHAMLSVYLTCEHRGLPDTGDVLQRTRSLRAGPLLRFLLWNMPYHAEHHAYPAVPFHALPRLHTLLAPRLPNQGRSVLALHLAGLRPAREPVGRVTA